MVWLTDRMKIHQGRLLRHISIFGQTNIMKYDYFFIQSSDTEYHSFTSVNQVNLVQKNLKQIARNCNECCCFKKK